MNSVISDSARSLLVLLAIVASVQAQQGSSISLTKHNLSVTGPGPYKSETESRICVFCHAPHRARKQVPLWNREDSRASYLTYRSSTFKGTVAQPNDTTKLCLSCHDGTIALGRVVSLTQEISMTSGRRLLDTGPAFLGSNLRDDHPVSFLYSSSRAGFGTEYRPAQGITLPVKLDPNGLVQCTSCHDAHDNTNGRFLRLTEQRSAICLACHTPRDWAFSAHAVSLATWNQQGLDPWPNAKYDNVRDNACANCHREHSAGQPERLLNFPLEEDNCLRCHNGNVAEKNIQQDIIKTYAHSPTASTGVHDPTENPFTMRRHAECQDCHDPHVSRAQEVQAPDAAGAIQGVSGISSSGSAVERITYAYELCYKCHADHNSGNILIPRVAEQANVRLEFKPGNPSFHPVEAAGRSADVPSLLSPWTTSSRIACTDCHQSNSSPAFGGRGAAGPHGSIYKPLLGANYDTRDNIAESSATYALCYKCHSRSSILADLSFKKHRLHIVDKQSPCSSCHDAHGISASQGTLLNNSHLINFDRSIVSSSPTGGRLEFVDQGSRKGTCTLMCHGKDHVNTGY